MPTISINIPAQAIKAAAQGLPTEDGQADIDVLKAYLVSIVKERVQSVASQKAIDDAKSSIDTAVSSIN